MTLHNDKKSYRYQPQASSTPEVTAAAATVPDVPTETATAASGSSSGLGYLDDISPAGDAPVKKSYRYNPQTLSSGAASSGMPYTPPAVVTESAPEAPLSPPAPTETAVSHSSKGGYLDGISPVMLPSKNRIDTIPKRRHRVLLPLRRVCLIPHRRWRRSRHRFRRR